MPRMGHFTDRGRDGALAYVVPTPIAERLNLSCDVPVMGISEFQNGYNHYDAPLPELRLPVGEPERAVTDTRHTKR